MSDVNSMIEACKKEVGNLTNQIEKTQQGKKDKTMGMVAKSDGGGAAPLRTPPATKVRRILKGHFGKITAMHWSGDSRHLVSASQDGNLLIWNACSSNKVQSISLKSSYVMSVGMEQNGNMVACGGLDNLCSVYRLSNPGEATEMASHDGFLSCCRFLDERRILTSSGDSTCILWDISAGGVVSTFAEHKQDAMFLSLSPTEKNLFVSSSVDRTAKVWDLRSPKRSVQTYMGHGGDVNGVDFMPSDGKAFATCSEDGTVRVFDMRAYNEVHRFQVADQLTSIAFSKSGRIIFVGHTDGNVSAFDVLSDKSGAAYSFGQVHERPISSIGVSPSGEALCTASWDSTLKIWA